jgi:hypothetical protein
MRPFKSHETRLNDSFVDAARASIYRPKRRLDLRTRRVAGETVVLDRREEFVHQLNKTASYIWQRCDGSQTPEEITEELCQAFDVDLPTARKDVLATVERLRTSKLLEDT